MGIPFSDLTVRSIFFCFVDSQRASQSKPIIAAAQEPQDFSKSAAGGLSSPRSSVEGPSSAPALGKPATLLTTVTAPAATAPSTVSNAAAAARSVRVNSSSTDDAYSDFNFWKIPPAILEDEY